MWILNPSLPPQCHKFLPYITYAQDTIWRMMLKGYTASVGVIIVLIVYHLGHSNWTVARNGIYLRKIIEHEALTWIVYCLQAEGSSAESIATIAKVDTVKRRMEAAYETLQVD